MIYRRAESRVVFMGNDNSNSYRNARFNSASKTPLAYIKQINNAIFSVGVGFFSELNGKIKINSNKLIPNELKELKNSPLFHEWELASDEIPLFVPSTSPNGNSFINYRRNGNGKILQFSKGPFNPPEIKII
jgi:hypothetical protein